MYKENLPISITEQCPPVEAYEPSSLEVYRLVSQFPPTINDFSSHYSLGKSPTRSPIDLCKWASCSVFKSGGNGINLKKLPKIKNKNVVVKLVLEVDSGKVLEGKNNHFDFWIYKAFDAVNGSSFFCNI